MKLSTDKIWTEWQKFRKDLGAIIHRDDLMQVNLEFNLDVWFYEKDTKEMLDFCDKMKVELTNIRESLK